MPLPLTHLGSGGVVVPSPGVARQENELVGHEGRAIFGHDLEIDHRSLSRAVAVAVAVDEMERECRGSDE